MGGFSRLFSNLHWASERGEDRVGGLEAGDRRQSRARSGRYMVTATKGVTIPGCPSKQDRGVQRSGCDQPLLVVPADGRLVGRAAVRAWRPKTEKPPRG